MIFFFHFNGKSFLVLYFFYDAVNSNATANVIAVTDAITLNIPTISPLTVTLSILFDSILDRFTVFSMSKSIPSILSSLVSVVSVLP